MAYFAMMGAILISF